MNYPKEQFIKLVVNLPKLLNHYKISREIIEEQPYIVHDLHLKMYMNFSYPDNNLNVIKIEGKRLFPYCNDFALYPEKCNDDQIETAMKKAIRIIKF